MSDDKKKRGPADRSKIAGGERYEIAYEAKKLGVPQKTVRAAQKAVGPSRAAVEKYVKSRHR